MVGMTPKGKLLRTWRDDKGDRYGEWKYRGKMRVYRYMHENAKFDEWREVR